MKRKITLTIIAMLLTPFVFADNKHAVETDYPSCKGSIVTGYQGWFRVPGKGVMFPDQKHVHVDMWPDVSEYEKTHPTGLKMADRSAARFLIPLIITVRPTFILNG